LVRQYLTVAASCKIALRPDQLGLKVAYVNETAGTHINTRAFLCALRRFYDFLIERSDYKDGNPFGRGGLLGRCSGTASFSPCRHSRDDRA
jgi:hypothetical protein